MEVPGVLCCTALSAAQAGVRCRKKEEGLGPCSQAGANKLLSELRFPSLAPWSAELAEQSTGARARVKVRACNGYKAMELLKLEYNLIIARYNLDLCFPLCNTRQLS
jgi:hypothetical protein